jgi:hypothetical protein
VAKLALMELRAFFARTEHKAAKTAIMRAIPQ